MLDEHSISILLRRLVLLQILRKVAIKFGRGSCNGKWTQLGKGVCRLLWKPNFCGQFWKSGDDRRVVVTNSKGASKGILIVIKK